MKPFETVSLLSNVVKNRQVSYETCRFLILFGCFFANPVFKQGSHVIPVAIQNTVNIDVVPIRPVESHIVSANKETIIAGYICDGGKRYAYQRMVTEHTNRFCDFTYHGDCCLWIFQISCNIVLNVRKVILCLIGEVQIIHRGSQGVPPQHPRSASLFPRRTYGLWQARSSDAGWPVFFRNRAYPRWHIAPARFLSKRFELEVI